VGKGGGDVLQDDFETFVVDFCIGCRRGKLQGGFGRIDHGTEVGDVFKFHRHWFLLFCWSLLLLYVVQEVVKSRAL
jgi:hypothetical protein